MTLTQEFADQNVVECSRLLDRRSICRRNMLLSAYALCAMLGIGSGAALAEGMMADRVFVGSVLATLPLLIAINQYRVRLNLLNSSVDRVLTALAAMRAMANEQDIVSADEERLDSAYQALSARSARDFFGKSNLY